MKFCEINLHTDYQFIINFIFYLLYINNTSFISIIYNIYLSFIYTIYSIYSINYHINLLHLSILYSYFFNYILIIIKYIKSMMISYAWYEFYLKKNYTLINITNIFYLYYILDLYKYI